MMLGSMGDLQYTLFFYFFDVHILIPRTYENTESSLLLYYAVLGGVEIGIGALDWGS